jgi:hypothetical protein
LPATGNGQAAGAETGFGAAGAAMEAGLAAGFFLPAFFFAFFFAGFFAFFFAGFFAFFAFFLAGFLAFFFAAFFLPERRFAFLAAGRFLAAFFLPEDFFLVAFFAAFLFAAIAILLMKVKQRALPALRRMNLLHANRQCLAARKIGCVTIHRTVLWPRTKTCHVRSAIRERGDGETAHIGQLPETKRKENLGLGAHHTQPGGVARCRGPAHFLVE